MRRLPVPRASSLRFLLLLLLALGLSVAVDADALPGVGGLAKKAKEKAAKAAGVESEEPAGENTVVFDDVVLELTGERLQGILAACKAAQAAGAERSAVVERLNKAQEEQRKLQEKNGDAIREAEQKRSDVAMCRHDALSEIKDRKMQEFSQKALTDPAIRAKFTKIAQQHNAAASQGDTTAIKSAQDAMMEEMLPTHDDTLSVYKSCGTMPPPLPAEVKLAGLDKQIASISEDLRQMDEKVSEAQAAQGGMSREQFAMAEERIRAYLAWRQSKSYSKSATRGYTKEEIDALEKYLAELRACMG